MKRNYGHRPFTKRTNGKRDSALFLGRMSKEIKRERPNLGNTKWPPIETHPCSFDAKNERILVGTTASYTEFTSFGPPRPFSLEKCLVGQVFTLNGVINAEKPMLRSSGKLFGPLQKGGWLKFV